MIVPRGERVDAAAVAAHYDDLDELYREIWGTSLHHGYWIRGNESLEQAVANLTRLAGERAGMRAGEQVCDLGCGYGAAAALWQREFGVAVTGLTISAKQLEYGRSSVAAHGAVRLMQADALRSGLPAETFDVVTAIESSEHMEDKAKFFSEAHRLLRPGGRFIVAAWLTRDRPNAWESRLLLEPICREGRLPGMASAAEYAALISAAHFRDVSTADLTSRVRETWSLCARRVARKFFSDASFRRLLFDGQFKNRIFAATVFRIWLAYRTGSMRFGLFTAVK